MSHSHRLRRFLGFAVKRKRKRITAYALTAGGEPVVIENRTKRSRGFAFEIPAAAAALVTMAEADAAPVKSTLVDFFTTTRVGTNVSHKCLQCKHAFAGPRNRCTAHALGIPGRGVSACKKTYSAAEVLVLKALDKDLTGAAKQSNDSMTCFGH